MRKNSYKEVILELEKEQDWRSIVFLLASMHPSIVMKIIDMLELKKSKKLTELSDYTGYSQL